MRAREQGTEVDTMRKGVRRGSQCGSGSAQGVQRQSALSLLSSLMPTEERGRFASRACIPIYEGFGRGRKLHASSLVL